MLVTLYRLPDGRTITRGVPFELVGIGKFPHNWLEKSSDEEMAKFGITREVADIVTPAQKKTWNDVLAEGASLLKVCEAVAMRCLVLGVQFPPEWVSYSISIYGTIGIQDGDPAYEFPEQPKEPVWPA